MPLTAVSRCRAGGLPEVGAPQQLLVQPGVCATCGAAGELTRQAGDILLLHPKLAHRACPNYGPNIRYMVYFRIKHRQHGQPQMMERLVGALLAAAGS